jgi:hypothetical protein
MASSQYGSRHRHGIGDGIDERCNLAHKVRPAKQGTNTGMQDAFNL